VPSIPVICKHLFFVDQAVAKGYHKEMSQPVKLSDELVCDARAIGQLSQRSIAGQIEFWAQLGRAMEPLLRGDRAMALQQAGQQRPVSEAIANVDSANGRKQVRDFLNTRPYPQFQLVKDRPGLLCRTEEDGTETIGRFVNRRFELADE
jgi:hypothetical protein